MRHQPTGLHDADSDDVARYSGMMSPGFGASLADDVWHSVLGRSILTGFAGAGASQAVSGDPLALTVYDAAGSREEDRWFTLGFDGSGKLLAVTYEDAEPGRARVRIISARKASRRELRYYEEEPR